MDSLSPHLTFRARIARWYRFHKVTTLLVAATVLISGAGATTFFLLNQQHPTAPAAAPSAPRPQPPKPVVYYSELTGMPVPSQAAATQAVTAIMIENSPDARPQSGLKQAGMVYEAIAEGGITRFLTLHQEDKPQLIGPVRSIRPYYIDWLTPYQASVAHVGGSPDALARVRNGSYRDIDQFFNSNYYWRATDRYAPHNVYTSFTKLDALNQSKGYTSSIFKGFSRTDAAPAATPTATSIAINFSGPWYNTTYTYDKASNSYLRSEGGAPHMDREDGQLAPHVVIAMKVDENLDADGYHEDITAIGSGEAVIFQNGTATTVTWHKPDAATGITFTDASGKDVPLVRGQTWIAAIPNGKGSVSWQ